MTVVNMEIVVRITTVNVILAGWVKIVPLIVAVTDTVIVHKELESVTSVKVRCIKQ